MNILSLRGLAWPQTRAELHNLRLRCFSTKRQARSGDRTISRCLLLHSKTEITTEVGSDLFVGGVAFVPKGIFSV